MSKNSIADYSTTAGSNTDIGGTNIDEGCAPSGMNDGLRKLMAHLATYRDSRVIGTDIQEFNANLASLSGLTLVSDRIPYSTGANTFALTGLSPYGRTLIAVLNSTSARNILDLPTRTATQITNTGDADHSSIGVFAGDELRSAILSLIRGLAIGEGQSWQDMSALRNMGTAYQNTTGRTIAVSVCQVTSDNRFLEVSQDGTNYVNVSTYGGHGNVGDIKTAYAEIPNNHWYRTSGGGTPLFWSELR